MSLDVMCVNLLFANVLSILHDSWILDVIMISGGDILPPESVRYVAHETLGLSH